MVFALFWACVGCSFGYIAASAIFAGKLADERARMLERLRRLQQETR